MKRRLFRGFSANLYGQGVTMLIQLVGVPIMLYSWGAQLYGEWLVLFAIPAYLSITDLGFSQSAANDMTAQFARGDRAKALAVFQSLGVLVLCACSIGLMVISALLLLVPLKHLLHFTVIDDVQARWILWCLSAEILMKLGDGINHAGFRAVGDYALHVNISSVTRLAQFLSIWIVALSGGGPAGAAIGFLVVRVVVTPGSALLLVRRHSWLRFGFRYAHHDELRRLAKPAMANIAVPLAQGLNIQGMVLVVGTVLNPVSVVVFSTLRTLTRIVLQLVLVVSHAVEPELASAYGAGNRVLMRSLFTHALRAGLWLAISAAAFLGIFGDVILNLWTHGRVAMNPLLFSALLASAIASVLWYGALIVLKAANKHTKAAIVFVLASMAAVGSGIALLILTQNVATAGFALLVMDVVMVSYTLRAVAPIIGDSALQCLAEAVNPYPLVRLARGEASLR